jgi:hypothetical protein
MVVPGWSYWEDSQGSVRLELRGAWLKGWVGLLRHLTMVMRMPHFILSMKRWREVVALKGMLLRSRCSHRTCIVDAWTT